MTEQEYDAWLADLTARRIVLAELHYDGGVEYVATHPFISLPGDSDPNRLYDDLLKSAVDISTRIDGMTQFGEVALLNDGGLNPWLDRAWEGHPIELYFGAPDWSRDDFRLIAKGRNGGITESRRGSLTFAMHDESRILDERIDTGQLPDDAGPVPLALGSVYNAPMPRVETATLTYQPSYLAVDSFAPKDNGNPVTFTGDEANGKLTMDATVVGTPTVDIEEQHNTPNDIVAWVAAQYGLTVSAAQLYPYTVGLYYDGEVTGAQILDDLCDGLGAYWYLDPTGGIVARRYTVNLLAPVATIVGDDIVRDQISLSETQRPWKSLTLRWGRNYSPLSAIAGDVEANQPTEAARLRRDWSDSSSTQSLPEYPYAETLTIDTAIADAADANQQRGHLMAFRDQRRDVWSIEAFSLRVSVGDTVNIRHPLLDDVDALVLAVSQSPTRGTSTLEVWV